MEPLGRRARVVAAVHREPVDRPPYAFWRHFPAVDRSPAGLAQATLRFQERYGGDLVILVPPAGYAAEAWGCVEADRPGPDGDRPCGSCAVRAPEDWSRVRPVDPAAAPGFLHVLETVVRIGFDRRLGDAPVLVMLPSPVTVAARLAGGRLAEDLRARPAAVEGALDAIAGTLARFGEALRAEGPSGVLYAVGPDGLDPATRDAVGLPRDRQVLDALGARDALVVLHLQAPPPDLGPWAALPAQAWSWEAGGPGPLLAEGWRRVPGAVVGGLDRATLRDGPPEEAARQVRRAVEATGGLGLIVGPGGVLPPAVPDATLAAVVKALGGPLRPLLGVSGLTR